MRQSGDRITKTLYDSTGNALQVDDALGVHHFSSYFGRGGDHTEFLNAGFPAVRFSVAVEMLNLRAKKKRAAAAAGVTHLRKPYA